MFNSVKAFSEGPRYHVAGIKFAFQHPSFFALAALPFMVTLSLYVFGFYLLHSHVDSFLNMIWEVDPEKSSKLIGWLYWAYTHTVAFFIYIVVLAVMFYTFVVCANILAVEWRSDHLYPIRLDVDLHAPDPTP